MVTVRHRKTTLRYAGGLLSDERGFLEWFVPLVSFVIGAGKTMGQRRAVSKSGKHYAERMMAYDFQQAKIGKEMDIEKSKSEIALNASRLEIFKASSFQKGSYTGPYFQVVKRS